jgi:cardiolipin synthase
MSSRWKSFEFLHTGDQFLKKQLELISSAQYSIDIESYIFMPDKMGTPILEALSAARKNSIQVQILVDGIGSSAHLKDLRSLAEKYELNIKVFNPLPAVSALGLIETDLSNRKDMALMLKSGLMKTFAKLNRRNHRKVTIADGQRAIIGGMNITDVTCESIWGGKAWRDSSVFIESPEIAEITESFRHAWAQSPFLLQQHQKFRSSRKMRSAHPNHHDGQIFTNDTPVLRKIYQREFFNRIRKAKTRIHFITPYFVPTRRLLKELAHAVSRGVRVQVILPQRSDVRFLDFLKDPYIDFLRARGVEIFEYRKTILHAKYSIIDDLGSMGSGNLNHRSLLHDLEVEATFSSSNGLEQIESQWNEDFRHCTEVTRESRATSGLLKRLLAQFIFWFRYYL